jgi:hypothetical protein
VSIHAVAAISSCRSPTRLGDQEPGRHQRRAGQRAQPQALLVEDGAERERAERHQQVHEGHRERADVTQQDRHEHEGERRPDHSEVDDRADRLHRHGEFAPVLADRRDDQQRRAAAEHCPAVEHDRVGRAAAQLLRHVADAHAEGRHSDGGGADEGELGVPAAGALGERQGQPADRHEDARDQASAERRVRQHERAEQGGVEREPAEEHRRQARGDVLLAPVDEAVREREREQRQHDRKPDVGAEPAAAHGRDDEQQRARGGEAQARAQQRRAVLEADLDRQPSA